MKEEIIFNCWCNAGLIAASNYVLNNSELNKVSETKEIKTVMPVQFHSINELLVHDEQYLSNSFRIKATLV